jgi:hypothetical protein
MKKHMLILPVFLVAVLALFLVATAPVSFAGDRCGGGEPFEEGELYFELNDTDGDLGIHGKIDGGPWKKVWIRDSKHRQIMKVKARGRLRQQGLTELFFESAEPTFDELPPEDFFNRFPEGYYKIYGWSEDGELLKSKSLIRHVMPAQPGLTEVDAKDAENGFKVIIDLNGVKDEVIKEECDDEDDAFAPTEVEPDENGNIVISWDPVETSHPTIGNSGQIEVELYQGVVEFEIEVDGEDFESVYSVDLPPSDEPSFTVPGAYLALGEEDTVYKYEVLVRDGEGGNQTAVESCFVVVPPE